MSSQGVSKPKLWLCLVFTTAATIVVLAGIVLFPTSFNPGLPLFLAGAFAVLVGLARVSLGLGKYYRMESDTATALLLWMGVCSLSSLDLHASQRSLASFTGGLAFLLFCQLALRSRKQWKGVVYTLIGICLATSLLAWVMGLLQAKQSGVLPPLRATFANHDTFSVLPLIGVCLAMGLIEKSGPKFTWVIMGLISFFMLTLYGTGCRAALVGFAVGAVAFILPLQFLRKDSSEKTRLFVGFPLILGLLATPFLGYQFASEAKWGHVADGTALEYQSLRLELLENGWKAVVDYPVLGAGPGAFGQAYQTVRPGDHEEELFVNIAHNDFLEFAVECGLPGLFLWCALTWFALRTPWKYLAKGRRPTEAAALIAAVVALAAFSVFNFIVVQRPVLWAQMWVFGLALSFPTKRERWEEAKFVRYAGGLLLIGAGLCTSLWGYRSLQAENFYLLGQQADQRLDLEEASAYYEQAAAFGVPRYDRVLQRIALMEKLRVFGDVDNLSQQLAILEEARDANPKRIPILLKLAEVQQKSGKFEETRITLDSAWAASPHNRHIFDSRLDFLLSQADLQGAARSMTESSFPQTEDSQRKFISVMFVLFKTDSSSGSKILSEWLERHPNEKGYQLAEGIVKQARQKKDWTTVLKVLEVWKKADPKNICLEENYAQALGESKGPEQEFSYIGKLMKGSLDNTETCYSNLLKRWANLGVAQGKGSEVEAEVASFLQVSPSRHWARAFLAEEKAGRGQYTEAVSLLREGLDRSPNEPELLMSLAGIFEIQGSQELAVNYYREVTRRYPENKEAAKRLKAALKKL